MSFYGEILFPKGFTVDQVKDFFPMIISSIDSSPKIILWYLTTEKNSTSQKFCISISRLIFHDCRPRRSLYSFWKPAKLTEISISINCVWKKIDLSRRQGIYLTQKFRRSIREYKDPLEVRLYFCRFDVNDTQYLMILVRSSNLGGVYSI